MYEFDEDGERYYEKAIVRCHPWLNLTKIETELPPSS